MGCKMSLLPPPDPISFKTNRDRIIHKIAEARQFTDIIGFHLGRIKYELDDAELRNKTLYWGGKVFVSTPGDVKGGAWRPQNKSELGILSPKRYAEVRKQWFIEKVEEILNPIEGFLIKEIFYKIGVKIILKEDKSIMREVLDRKSTRLNSSHT